MNQVTEGVFLDPETEAERLWQGAQDAIQKAGQSVVCLSEAVDLGVRVVELMVVRCLQPVQDEFPATITGLLEPLSPDVDPKRDFLHPPKSLHFIDVVDLLSERNRSVVYQSPSSPWLGRPNGLVSEVESTHKESYGLVVGQETARCPHADRCLS